MCFLGPFWPKTGVQDIPNQNHGLPGKRLRRLQNPCISLIWRSRKGVSCSASCLPIPQLPALVQGGARNVSCWVGLTLVSKAPFAAGYSYTCHVRTAVCAASVLAGWASANVRWPKLPLNLGELPHLQSFTKKKTPIDALKRKQQEQGLRN